MFRMQFYLSVIDVANGPWACQCAVQMLSWDQYTPMLTWGFFRSKTVA